MISCHHDPAAAAGLRRMRGLSAPLLAGLLVTTVSILSPSDAFASGVGLAAPPATSVVARPIHAVVDVYASPSSRTPFAHLSPSDSLLVVDTALQPYWVKVGLVRRPNGSTGWVRGGDVALSRDSYFLRANTTTHRLTLFRSGIAVDSVPVGVGRSVLPTPTGTYFLATLLKQPNPNGVYGPYAFGLSAFSNVLQSFGGGPGEIGLHGTDAPTSVGSDQSHGCLRVTNTVIEHFARILPLGTPIQIVR